MLSSISVQQKYQLHTHASPAPVWGYTGIVREGMKARHRGNRKQPVKHAEKHSGPVGPASQTADTDEPDSPVRLSRPDHGKLLQTALLSCTQEKSRRLPALINSMNNPCIHMPKRCFLTYRYLTLWQNPDENGFIWKEMYPIPPKFHPQDADSGRAVRMQPQNVHSSGMNCWNFARDICVPDTSGTRAG